MIHKTAIIDSKASLADDVVVGPYTVIGAGVEIGSGCEIGPHVVIDGPTKIGKNNRIYQYSSIGADPQDKKFTPGEQTVLEIGDGNLIRESCTINRGTVQGGNVTKIGNNNWIMAYVHIAHDCIVGNDNIFANNTSLAGHVLVDNFVILGGFTLVSQFNYLASHSFSAMGSVISRNIPPYVLVSGHMAKPVGINTEGLKRRGFSTKQINNIRRAYKVIYRSGLKIDEAEKQLAEIEQEDSEVSLFLSFLEKQQGGIIR